VNYSGTAFNQPMHHAFGYNDRREVNLARQFEGTSDRDPEMLTRKREYGLDNIGNRLTHTVGGGSPVSYTPNQLNQYSHSGEGARAYDFDGNLTWTVGANLERYYHWDGENRLREVENSLQQTATFTYDYRGRRVRAVIFTQADLIEERYIWDDWNLLLVLDANNQPVQKFTWGLDIAEQAVGLPRGGRPGAAAGGVGGLLGASMSQGGGAVDHLFFYDGNGNVGQLLDWASGQTVAHYEYDPFGNIVASTGSRATVNRFRFSTKYQDELTELYYYGYRFYSPSMGRWLNRDPINEPGFQMFIGALSLNWHSEDDQGYILEDEFDDGEGWNRLLLSEEEEVNLYSMVGNTQLNRYDILGLRVDSISATIRACLRRARDREARIRCWCLGSPDPCCERNLRGSTSVK
jgi:RHS repeat-associated protein